MAVGLLRTVTLIVSTCSKHVSRAARKLRRQGSGLSPVGVLSRRSNVVPFGGSCKRQLKKRDSDEEEDEEEEEMEVEACKEGVWRRTILMGEKCQPLDFPGVIYYDADGKLLSTPRSPMRSPLHSLATRSPIAGDCKRHC